MKRFYEISIDLPSTMNLRTSIWIDYNEWKYEYGVKEYHWFSLKRSRKSLAYCSFMKEWNARKKFENTFTWQITMKIIIFPLLAFLERSRKNLFEKKLLSFSLFLPFLMPFYEWLGKWKAYKVFCHSKKSVPWYKNFFKKSWVEISSIEDFWSIPISSKKNYVKKHSIEERCVDWEIPAHWVIVDESSWTSWVPTNWVRWYDERKSVKKMLQIAFQNHFGDEKMIAICYIKIYWTR